ncbi:STAS domain-containing protein [Spirillospora sp. CA-255316]
MSGTLHAATVDTAEAQILSTIVLSPRPLRLVLDMTDITGIDSRGVSLLAKTRFAVHAARGTLHVLAPPGTPVQHALDNSVLSAAVKRVHHLSDILPRDDSHSPRGERRPPRQDTAAHDTDAVQA